MTRILEKFADLPPDTGGATAVEYGLIVSLIVIAMIGALQSLASRTNEIWYFIANTAQSVM